MYMTVHVHKIKVPVLNQYWIWVSDKKKRMHKAFAGKKNKTNHEIQYLSVLFVFKHFVVVVIFVYFRQSSVLVGEPSTIPDGNYVCIEFNRQYLKKTCTYNQEVCRTTSDYSYFYLITKKTMIILKRIYKLHDKIFHFHKGQRITT